MIIVQIVVGNVALLISCKVSGSDGTADGTRDTTNWVRVLPCLCRRQSRNHHSATGGRTLEMEAGYAGKQDLYSILGVERTATEAEIKKAYRTKGERLRDQSR